MTQGDPDTAPNQHWLSRLTGGLARTRTALGDGLQRLFGRAISHEALDELEELLLGADVGVAATQRILADIQQRLARRELADGAQLKLALRRNMLVLLTPVARPLVIEKTRATPFVVLMVGINGAGKTTTLGKLTHYLHREGYQVVLAAGDTFRAAAIEQLLVWGERNQTPVIAQAAGADAAAVVFDALQAATARHADVLIADTAGRLHTQANLMDELKKIKRVLGKQDPSAPHETLLVIDAGNGQNALQQAVQFHQAIGITGIVLTKLDGTAKGGIVFALAQRLGIPIRFIGIGEGLDDLRPFDAEQFVDALLSAPT
ncbi:MAG: signal recognition particle-docking protein FtsY [Pseudomonadota bacterium]